MKNSAEFHHIQINAGSRKSRLFYVKLFRKWKFEKVYSDPDVIGYTDGVISLWISKAETKFAKKSFHRKAPGLNHLAFSASSKKRVTEFYETFLKRNKIKVLYGGPKEYPEYGKGYF